MLKSVPIVWLDPLGVISPQTPPTPSLVSFCLGNWSSEGVGDLCETTQPVTAIGGQVSLISPLEPTSQRDYARKSLSEENNHAK